jgi:electron transfer flavoprotein alpha/beta subunit
MAQARERQFLLLLLQNEKETELKGIVTLCGSTRFRKEFEEVNRVLELNDWVVLTVASYYHSEKSPPLRKWIERNKKQLDKLHLSKIEISQAIVVIDVRGYIGSSTRGEISHAKKLDKIIYYWSDKSWLALTDQTENHV